MSWLRRRPASRGQAGERRPGPTTALGLVTDLEPLAEGEVARLRAALGARRAALLLAEDGREPFAPFCHRGCDESALTDLRFGRDSRLVKWLVVNETALDLLEAPQVRDYLTDTESTLLRRLGVDVIHPVLSMNHLVGLLLLGDIRVSASEREHLLRDLLPLFGLALHNALLLRQGRQRVRGLYRAERLATLGELAAGAAHEIRNPLTSIRSTMQYLRPDFEEGSEKAVLVDELLGEVDRINGIIAGLLSFARPAQPILEEIDVPALLRQVGRLLDSAARTQGVEFVLPEEEGRTRGDPDQLKQVFLNLCMNALQAMPEGGRLSLGMVRSDHTLRVSVADTGPGIPAEDLDLVFDPFFTTREEGTGLGLAVCYGIVSRHKGQIDIESRPGAGTTVHVRLPFDGRAR